MNYLGLKGCDNGRDAIVIVKCCIEYLREGCDSNNVLCVYQEQGNFNFNTFFCYKSKFKDVCFLSIV